MRYNFLLTFILLSVFIKGKSQNTERNNYTLKLLINEDNYYETPVPKSAYILPENTIQIYPGEKILIELETENNKITSMKAVNENKYPLKTIEISFLQITEEKEHKNMMLKITNPFPNELSYTANIFLMEQEKWVNSKVIPIKPNKTTYEIWPDIIVTATLSGWEFDN